MKNLLIYTFCAMALLACNSGQKQNNGGNVSAASNSADTISAYEIFKMINPEEAEKYKDADTAGMKYFAYSDVNWEEYGAKDVIVQCLNHKDGGTLAVYQSISYDELDNIYIDFLKFYLYSDGQLAEQNNLLPEPTIDDFAQLDGLTFYKPDQKVKELFAEKNFRHKFDPKTGLIATSVCIFNDDLTLYYAWNGSKFVLDPKRDSESSQNLIHSAGLGNVLLGDNPPEEIIGFQKKVIGKTVSFSRHGDVLFQFSLNDDGKIDTIFVHSPLYTYRIDCEGPDNEHFGIDYYASVDFCFGGDHEFVFKDGVWVRRISEYYSYWCGIMASAPKANIFGTIDFYTTKDAITNLYPENGKVVKWDDHPKFNENAAVTLIKIYRAQPNTSDDEDMDPEAELESLDRVGDMTDIWRQFAEGQYDAVEPTIEGNTAEYFDQSSDEGYTIRIKLVSFAWEGSCKVFCVTDHTEGDESTNTLTEYNFIGGELSETELQPTLKEYVDKSEASIENGEIVFASQDVAFLWNGSMMIKE